MSDIALDTVSCPACGAQQEAELFSSVNARLLPQLVQAIAAGTFERLRCERCERTFQPEHPLLLSGAPGGVWLVMRPWSDAAAYAAHEAELEAVLARELAAADAALGGARIRPRLVFGQRMLTEAVRLIELGLDPPVVECAKLLWVRRNLAALLEYGPSVLCVEGPAAGGALRCSVLALESGEPIGEAALPIALLEEVRQDLDGFRALAPRLFDRPYSSAARYLYP